MNRTVHVGRRGGRQISGTESGGRAAATCTLINTRFPMRTMLFPLLMAAVAACSGCTNPNDGDPGPGPDPVNDRVVAEGVYYGVRTNLITGHTIKVYMTFLSDGRVFGGYPKEGLEVPVNWERECRFAPCGTYTKTGETVVMHWTGESARNESFRLDAQDVLHTTTAPETTYRRLTLMEGTLEGRYGIMNNQGDNTTTEITFGRDGRFRDKWVAWYTGWDTESSGPDDGSGEGEGTYTIRKGTLRLRYNDGSVVQRLIMVPPAGNSASTVQIGGNMDYPRMP